MQSDGHTLTLPCSTLLADEEEEEEEDDDDEDDEDDGFPGLELSAGEDSDEQSDEVEYANGDGEAQGEGEAGLDVAGGEEDEQLGTDDELEKLGLPKKGTKLNARQKKKALAEAERLEELLRSQGHLLNEDEDGEDDEDDEDEEEGDDAVFSGTGESIEGDELNDDELAFLEGEEEDDDEQDEDEQDDDEDDLEDEEADDVMLPTVDGAGAQDVDLQAVQMRIQEIVTILNQFKTKGSKGGRSRSEYTEQLLDDICNYYGYNRFLAEKFFELFSPSEAIEFFEANETPRPVTIRANTLRTRRRDLAQALINRGVNLEPIAGRWTKVGLQVFESSVPIGATPEYLAGHYMLQAASSFLPCIALAPQPNERVLDMASAPGGKSTYLAALMQNTGVIFANDSNKTRTKSLSANIHRLGCTNVVVCNYDARMFPKVIGGFDRVLLDSPCSGSGVVSKDASVKTNKVGIGMLGFGVGNFLTSSRACSVQSDRDLQLLTHLQKQLILCAIDSINARSRTGGYLVYSTCSVLVEENEQIVQYALEKRRNVKIVNSGVEIGRDGFKSFRGRTFDDKMHFAKRIFVSRPPGAAWQRCFICSCVLYPHLPASHTSTTWTASSSASSRSSPDRPKQNSRLLKPRVKPTWQTQAMAKVCKQRHSTTRRMRRGSKTRSRSRARSAPAARRKKRRMAIVDDRGIHSFDAVLLARSSLSARAQIGLLGGRTELPWWG